MLQGSPCCMFAEVWIRLFHFNLRYIERFLSNTALRSTKNFLFSLTIITALSYEFFPWIILWPWEGLRPWRGKSHKRAFIIFTKRMFRRAIGGAVNPNCGGTWSLRSSVSTALCMSVNSGKTFLDLLLTPQVMIRNFCKLLFHIVNSSTTTFKLIFDIL